jgi:hypothetical protein
MTWSFNDVRLTVGATYQFVFITTDTPTLNSHVTFNALELNVPAGTADLAETAATPPPTRTAPPGNPFAA